MRERELLLAAAALSLLLAAVYTISIDIRATRGASITGDEPFYLLTTQSLLADGDFDLRNQYESKSYKSFFDHADDLWFQSVPRDDGRLLSPHNPGLSFLLIPGFALGGLVGVQIQLLLLASATLALAFVLADRMTGHRLIIWVVSLGVGLPPHSSILPKYIRHFRRRWPWLRRCCWSPVNTGLVWLRDCGWPARFRSCAGWAPSMHPWL